jgi:hypothetical protein
MRHAKALYYKKDPAQKSRNKSVKKEEPQEKMLELPAITSPRTAR